MESKKNRKGEIPTDDPEIIVFLRGFAGITKNNFDDLKNTGESVSFDLSTVNLRDDDAGNG